MKKLIALLLAMVMMCSVLAACGNGTGAGSEKTPITDSMEAAINKITEKNPVELMGIAVMPLDLTDTSEDGLWALQGYTGLENGDKLEDAAFCESMVGSMAFSLVMVRVKDAADTQSVAQQMSDNINTAKWICVQADEKLVAGYDDVIMLVMLDSQLGMTAQSFVDAFKSVYGIELDFTI